MNEGRTVFSQFCAHLPSSSFRRCVARYQADRYVKTFSCGDQFLCMAFAQVLIGMARRLYSDRDLAVELQQTIYALDSTTIDLCLSLFPWAPFQ